MRFTLILAVLLVAMTIVHGNLLSMILKSKYKLVRDFKFKGYSKLCLVSFFIFYTMKRSCKKELLQYTYSVCFLSTKLLFCKFVRDVYWTFVTTTLLKIQEQYFVYVHCLILVPMFLSVFFQYFFLCMF